MLFQSIKSAAFAAAVMMAGSAGALAQEADPASSKTATRITGWGVQCMSPSRSGVMNCKAEQQLLLADTNQLFVKITVSVNGESKKPSMVVQLPVGLHLPAGVKLQFDDNEAETHPVETCDGQACYVLIADAARVIVSMKGGNDLKVMFKNMNRDDIETTVPLSGFSDAFKAIE